MLRKEKLISTKGATYHSIGCKPNEIQESAKGATYNCNSVLFYVAPSELAFLQHSFSIGLRPMLIYVAPLVLVRNISYLLEKLIKIGWIYDV